MKWVSPMAPLQCRFPAPVNAFAMFEGNLEKDENDNKHVCTEKDELDAFGSFNR